MASTNKIWDSLHIFLSTALLASLGVTVLVVYVMNPPVKFAIEGAYVTAATITGLLTGGLAVVFPEVTEALGCLLGGFCVSMWCQCPIPRKVVGGVLLTRPTNSSCIETWGTGNIRLRQTYTNCCLLFRAFCFSISPAY